MQSSAIQTLLHKIRQTKSSFSDKDAKDLIVNLYTSNPRYLCLSIAQLIMNPDLERRQEGMFLLVYISKSPYYLQLFDQSMIKEAENEISKAFHNDFGQCTIRYKALGILYARICSPTEISLISENMFDCQHSTLMWLKCFGQLLSNLKTVNMDCYTSITQIFQKLKDMNRLAFEEEVSELYECFESYVKITKSNFPEKRGEMVVECIALLSSTCNRFFSYSITSKRLELFYEICHCLTPLMTFNIIQSLFTYTSGFLKEQTMIAVWIELIQTLDLKLFQEQMGEETPVRMIIEGLCMLLIENVSIIDNCSQSGALVRPIIDDDTDFRISYVSAQLLITLLNKINITPIRQRINQRTIVRPDNKVSRILYSVIECCCLEKNEKELNTSLQKIFKMYVTECQLLLLRPSSREQTEMIKVITFGITQMLVLHSDKIIKVSPTLISGMYLTIMEILKCNLEQETIQFIRQAFKCIISYGEKYLVQKSSNKELKEIALKFIFNPNSTKEERAVKDLIADYAITLMKKKTSNQQRLVYLSEFPKIRNMHRYKQESDEAILCSYLTSILDEMGRFKNEELYLAQNLVRWMLDQMGEGFSSLLEPFSMLLKLNYDTVIPLIDSQGFKTLAAVGTKNPDLYFPLIYERLLKEYDEKSMSILFHGIIKELNTKNPRIQKLRRLSILIRQCYKFEYFQTEAALMVETLFQVLNNNKSKIGNLSYGLQSRKVICEAILFILFEEDANNFSVIQRIKVKELLEFLRFMYPAFQEINFLMKRDQAEVRLQILMILNFFIGIIEDKKSLEVRELIHYAHKISVSVPMDTSQHVDQQLIQKFMHTVRVANRTRLVESI